jgi:hypothetical protein
MAHIDAGRMTDEALEGYDDMMMECVLKIEKFAGLATAIWSDVLQELERRGKAKLISGSYDDLGNALIHRVRKP